MQVEEDALSVRAEHQHAAYKATIDHSFVRVQGPDRLFKYSSCSVGVGLGGVHFIQTDRSLVGFRQGLSAS